MQARKDLLLYKRHLDTCSVHKSRIPVANRRYWMECECPIWIVGRTPNGADVPRQTTGYSDVASANRIRLSLLKQTQSETHKGPLLSDCINDYLKSRDHELRPKTITQTKYVLSTLQQFCESKCIHYSRDLTVNLIETFKVDGFPDLAGTSKVTVIAKLRCFLRAAFMRDWITVDIAAKVRGHFAEHEQKDPYSDEEVNLILAESLRLKGGTHGYSRYPATLRLLFELMLATGMRVSDATLYDPRACFKGEYSCWVYSFVPVKTKRIMKKVPMDVYLPEELKQAIDACKWLSIKLPFHYGSDNPHLCDEVYKRMKTIGSRCGVNDCRPHRLRDTFAVRKLLAGFQVDDVSRLLGHSSVVITQTYYAKWIKARRNRLEQLVSETFVNP